MDGSMTSPKVKTYRVFSEAKFGSISPKGWLRLYLEKQRDGLTGHLDEAAGYPFNTPGWRGHVTSRDGNDVWWPYEQTGYWLDGMVRCALLLGDEKLKAKAESHILYNLDNHDSDGYVGPAFLKTESQKTSNRWPHAVFFRAMMAYQSATEDQRTLQVLARHYLSGTASHMVLRDVCNIETMLWLYERTGEKKLLDLSVSAIEGNANRSPVADTSLASLRSDKSASEHGVTYNEIAKLGAILSMYNGDKQALAASVNAYRKIDRDHMLIDGVNSSSEHLAGKDALASHETCDIADLSWSLGYLLMATGDASYADKIERACFNAAPGAVKSDFKALQYFSCPNQVVADSFSNHNLYHRGLPWMSYRPCPNKTAECCPGEVNRIMPNFVSRLWLKGEDGSIAAVMYAPCSFETILQENPQHSISIEEETSYPFSSKVKFKFKMNVASRFAFKFRVPGWCRKASVKINGGNADLKLVSGAFAVIDREFSSGDEILLDFPMETKFVRWPTGGCAIERGPLVFALGIEEDWTISKDLERCSKDFPNWELRPKSRWNYALDIDESEVKNLKIEVRGVCGDPWSFENAPIVIKVPARRILGWRLRRVKRIKSIRIGGMKKIDGDFSFTPSLPKPDSLKKRLGKRVETVELRPYGCTHLRLAIMPFCKKE